MISIRSAAGFARECAIQEWGNYEVVEFSLEEFKDNIGRLVAEENILMNVFSIDDKPGFVVKWDELWRDINDELEQYI